MELMASKWAGKRVFLTGHTGFKGGWLAVMLNRLGAEVHGFALDPSTTPNLFETADIATLCQSSTIADIRDARALAAAVAAAKPDLVIHMAAQALVGTGYDDPVGTYATNVMGTIHLYEAIRALDRPIPVVNVTSDKCYENREWLWAYRENEPMGGYDPYSNSKGCAELVTSAYRSSYFTKSGVRLASARAGNVIGGGDWSEARLVPDLLRSFDAGTELVLRAPGAVRPWQHVLEPLSGYLLLAEHLMASDDACEGWNFGPAEADVRTVGWVVATLLGHLGADINTRTTPESYHEATLLKLDSSQARARLGWQPQWTVDRALRETANWHLAFGQGALMLDICRQQVETYLTGAD